MFRNWSITWRLSVLVLLGTGCILLSLTGYSYFAAKEMLEAELMDNANDNALSAASRVETLSRKIETAAKGLAAAAEQLPLSGEQAYSLTEGVIRHNEDIFGVAMAMEGLAGQGQSVPYAYQGPKGVVKTDLAQAGYPYQTRDWYVLPRQLKQPVWSEPYYDEGGGNVLMATYAVPVFSRARGGEVTGVVTADMSLDRLSGLLEALDLGDGNYPFVLSAQGRYIAHPNPEMVMKESIFSVAGLRGDTYMEKLGKSMTGGGSGYIPYQSEVNGKSGWVVYRPVPGTGWSVGIFFSRDELMGRVIKLNRTQLYLTFLGLTVLLAVVLGISRSITRPIRELEQATRSLAAGNFDVTIPTLPGDDEVARLSGAFSRMSGELKSYMEEVRKTTANKERMASELRIAHSIQMSLVPKTFPPYPERREFELFALLEPAREVGGDFYDFFFLDEDTLWLAIGDVSDKGVAAALFMAVTRTMLRSLAKEVQDPAAIVTRLNDELAVNNESCMFVTLFCASVHLPSGHCRYASGGHCPSVLLRPDGTVGTLMQAKGPAVGAMEGMNFTEGAFDLQRGELLFLYTDGVTEAANTKQALFGEGRMLEVLKNGFACTTEQLLYRMQAGVGEFVQGAEQSDDMTMLAFRYYGKPRP